MLDDIRAIECVINSHATLADGGNPDAITGQFTADGELRAGGRTFAGERLTKFYGAAPRDVHTSKHIFSNVVIDLDGDDAAHAVTYFQVLNTTGLQARCRHIDQFRKVDGAWKIAVREVAVDGSVPAQ
ncbi:MAG: nuclear transport factor 2 family protein [Acidimicrobiia bacterium]